MSRAHLSGQADHTRLCTPCRSRIFRLLSCCNSLTQSDMICCAKAAHRLARCLQRTNDGNRSERKARRAGPPPSNSKHTGRGGAGAGPTLQATARRRHHDIQRQASHRHRRRSHRCHRAHGLQRSPGSGPRRRTRRADPARSCPEAQQQAPEQAQQQAPAEAQDAPRAGLSRPPRLMPRSKASPS